MLIIENAICSSSSTPTSPLLDAAIYFLLSIWINTLSCITYKQKNPSVFGIKKQNKTKPTPNKQKEKAYTYSETTSIPILVM